MHMEKCSAQKCSALPPDGKCFVCHQEAELTDGTLFSLSRSLAENWVTEDIFMHNKRAITELLNNPFGFAGLRL